MLRLSGLSGSDGLNVDGCQAFGVGLREKVERVGWVVGCRGLVEVLGLGFSGFGRGFFWFWFWFRFSSLLKKENTQA